jgi:phage tail sheath gpL-like
MSSPNIQFTTIPGNIRKPGAYFEENTSNAIQGLTGQNDKVVILAQMTPSGIATPLTPTKIFDSATAQLYFGAGSVAHLASEYALAANPYVDLTVVPISDAGGSSKASGTVVIGDTSATTAGQFSLWVGDQLAQYSYAAGDSKASITAGLMTSLNNISNELPVTDTSSAGTITFTAKNAGNVGNYIDFSAKASAGLSTITIGTMTGGAGDPVLGVHDTTNTALGVITGSGYTVIVNTIPTSTALTAGKNFVEFVSGPLEQRPAIQVSAVTDLVDTQANLVTLATGLNHGRTSLPYISYANDNLAKTEAFKIAGAYGAVIASQSDPAVPYDGLILSPLAAPSVIDRFSRTTEEYLLNNGLTPLDVAPGDQVQIVRAISTYVVNSFSIPDPTLLDINTIRTLDYVRAQIRTRLSARFVRAKLSPRIAASIKDQVIDVLYLMQALEIVQNVATYKNGVIVETDISDPTRIDVKIPANIVSGLHVISGQIILIL